MQPANGRLRPLDARPGRLAGTVDTLGKELDAPQMLKVLVPKPRASATPPATKVP